MQRPMQVEISTYLILAVIVMELAVAWTTPPPPGYTILVSTETGIGATIVALLQLIAVSGFWNGMSWARYAVMVYAVLAVLNVYGAHAYWDIDRSAAALICGRALLAAYLLIYLSTRPARAWFVKLMPSERLKQKRSYK